MIVGRMDETHQKSHPEKYAFGDHPDPNIDNPYAHHCSLEKHTRRTERLVWCILEVLEEHSKHNQKAKAPNNQENDQKNVLEEYHPAEQMRVECL